MRHNFGVLILSHGRPETIGATIGTMLRRGYTGPWWIVLDTDDTTAGEYADNWGAERIVTFNKADITVDMGDNGGSEHVVVYARNATDGIAAGLGLDFYCVLDDDYTFFGHRYVENGVLEATGAYHLDDVFDACLDFLETSGALTVCWSQGGDYIGGAGNSHCYKGLSRKAMNSFILRTGRPIPFVGRINEDANAYSLGAMRGELMFTLTGFYLGQTATQQSEGGLTEAYLETGTYRKSFYTVMMTPSSTRLTAIGPVNYRIHHRVDWDRAAPKILSGRWQKPRP